jgi:hypothetical protein
VTNLVFEEETHYCAVHPDRETELRCNKCDRYMCAQCAVSTPVGYRCRECVRQVEDKFFTGTNTDYIVIFAISLGLSIVGAMIASIINFIILTFFIGIFWAGFIGEANLRMTQRRRGRNSAPISVAGVVLGGIIGGALYSIFRYQEVYGDILAMLEATARQSGMTVEEVRAMAGIPSDIFMPIGEFIMSNLTSGGVLIFIGVVAVTLYVRMK